MNQNLVIGTVQLDLVASDLDAGSLRRDISRGASLPEVLTIKHQTIKDSASKRLVNRSVMKIERTIAVEGGLAVIPVHMVVSYPLDTVIPTVEIETAVSHLISLVSPVAPTAGQGLSGDAFIKRLQ